MNFGRR